MSPFTFSILIIIGVPAVVFVAAYAISWLWEKINDAYAWVRTQIIYWYVRRRIRQETKALQKTLEKTLHGVKVWAGQDHPWIDLSRARLKSGGHRYKEYERLRNIEEIEAKLGTKEK